MSTIFKRILSLLTAAALCICLCSCGEASDDALERIIDSGEFVFGMADGNEPISWFDEEGTARGLAVEYGELIASKLGAKARFVHVQPEAAVDSLNSNQIDCYLFLGDPGVKLSSQIQTVDTNVDSKQIILVLASSPITRLVDLSGKQMGVISNSDAAASLSQATELSGALSGTDSASDTAGLLSLLNNGTVDAVAIDYVDYLHHTLSDRSAYRAIDEQLSGGDYVLAFQREDEALCSRVDQLISVAASDGSLSQLTGKWLAVGIRS